MKSVTSYTETQRLAPVCCTIAFSLALILTGIAKALNITFFYIDVSTWLDTAIAISGLCCFLPGCIMICTARSREVTIGRTDKLTTALVSIAFFVSLVILAVIKFS